MVIDLHLHSNRSDGTKKPIEVLRIAKANGCSAAAITDHDTIKGASEVIDTEIIEFVAGVELSAYHEGKALHVLGYYIDLEDNNLLSKLDKQIEYRRARAHEMVDKLEGLGLIIDHKTLFEKENISRAHLAQMIVEQGKASNMSEAFHNYLMPGAPGYVAIKKVDYQDVINMIKNAGGIPILAHPGLNIKENLIENLDLARRIGIRGFEIYHMNNNQEVRKVLLDYCEEHDMLITGGSDYHGTEKHGRVGLSFEPINYHYLEKMKERL